jgi:hypothetical protein
MTDSLMESRIRGDVYVRFGGEHLKTCHRNMERRWVLSLHTEDNPIAFNPFYTEGAPIRVRNKYLFSKRLG